MRAMSDTRCAQWSMSLIGRVLSYRYVVPGDFAAVVSRGHARVIWSRDSLQCVHSRLEDWAEEFPIERA